MAETSYNDLLIIGAGPAGLLAACWAAKYDMSTRIVDQKSGRTRTGHADGIHSRTLEILESFGFIDPVLRQGVRDVEMCYWVCKLLKIACFVLYIPPDMIVSAPE